MVGIPSLEAVSAAAILRADLQKHFLTICDISQLFLDLEEVGIDVGGVALRRVPGGVYSEDVEIWLAHLCDGDFGHFGPGRIIQLFDKGRRICHEIVAEEYKHKPELLTRVLSILKFNEKEIRFVLGATATDLPTVQSL